MHHTRHRENHGIKGPGILLSSPNIVAVERIVAAEHVAAVVAHDAAAVENIAAAAAVEHIDPAAAAAAAV
jgi:hypothetical protein